MQTVTPIVKLASVKQMLTPAEERLVELISSAIINHTFNHETRRPLSTIQRRQTELSQHRKTGYGD